MHKFRVEAQETVLYVIEVEAENEATLNQQISNGEISFNSVDIVDGENFHVTFIEHICEFCQ
jgi:hypothetical protein